MTLIDPPSGASPFCDQFEALVHWHVLEAGLAGRDYLLTGPHAGAQLRITRIKHKVDPVTGSLHVCRSLQAGDVAVCNVSTSLPLPAGAQLALQGVGTSPAMATVMLKHVLRRAENLHTQALSVDRAQREALNGHQGRVLWFTGLSGAGKSTLANALDQVLHAQGWHTYVLDGDNVRQGLNKDLGFTDADRVENIRRIAEVARLMADAGLVVMTAFISPFRRERQMARDLIGEDRFLEIHVNTPLAVCEARDVKGLYRKARQGLIPNMTGINSPYEPPEAPGLVLSGAHDNLTASVSALQTWLELNASRASLAETPR